MSGNTRTLAYASGLLILAGGISLAGSVRTEWAHPLILVDDLSRSPFGPQLAPYIPPITVLAVALVLGAAGLRTIAKPVWSVLPVLAAGMLTSLLLIIAGRAIQHRTYVLL